MNQRDVCKTHSDVTNDPDCLQSQDLFQADDAVDDEEDNAKTFDTFHVVNAATARANPTHYGGIMGLFCVYTQY